MNVKTTAKLLLAISLGVLGGASGMQVLQAQTATLPGYIVMNIQSVSDQAMFDKYRSMASKSRAPFGGNPIVAHAKPVAVDSSALPRGEILIFKFPSLKAAQDWWHSPAYAAAQPLRENSTVSTAYAVEGTMER
jgi:uncharacterized protein (DUF1330 family)